MSERVLVALSGGVDSSVALLKVLETGYEAVGVTMKLWEYGKVGGRPADDNGCCALDGINAAREVCSSLGVPHYTLDLQDVFRTSIIDPFINEYLNGRTPNPCVLCNISLKWGALLDQANRLGIEKIVTGHYACIRLDSHGEPRLLKGTDPRKEQSYVLWGIRRSSLSRTILPLGEMTKSQVRKLARDRGLVTADVPESQEICFIIDNDYRRFLSEHAGGKLADVGDGKIVNENGTVIGLHHGYMNFTIGQRRGLGIAHSEPLYVKAIDPVANQITVAPKAALFGSVCDVGDLNWLVDPPTEPVQVHTRLRYNSAGSMARLMPADESVKLEFEEPQLAITPGQSAVFYNGDVVMGGGIIRG